MCGERAIANIHRLPFYETIENMAISDERIPSDNYRPIM